MNKNKLLIAALPLALVACDNPADMPAPSQVSVRFATTAPSASLAASGVSYSASAAAPLVITGSNGSLSVSGIRFIVSELELERLESTCDNSGSGNLCDDYEAPISFVELPLAGGAVTVATDAVPHGDYDELDFEVENVEADADDDSQKQQQIAALLSAIRANPGLGNFPEQASMVVEGTFTPAGSTQGRPFRVFFDAEIEVELRFDPMLTIDGNGASRAVEVNVQPALWFSNADGTVMDLSEFDHAATGEVREFDVEVARGFAQVEWDD